MKRTLCCAAAAVAMLFSGCAADITGGKPELDRTFSAEANIAVGGDTVVGTLCRSSDNCWSFSVTAPYMLEGLTVTYNDGETSFSMLGFECAADFSDSAVSALKLLAEAYESAADNAGGFENGVLEYTNENGTFSVTLDEKGMPSAIKAGGISVSLSEWTENTTQQNTGDELILLE
ncbi:MAG: hypothetical protein IJY73_07980 [Oscillospiraceae bacterium]|nr:hypothetical protein [Oscillospiraceae bacterium]